MEDFEIVDLMETLEDIGLETQEAFKVEGHKVPDEHQSAYTVIPKGHYIYTAVPAGESDYDNYNDFTVSSEDGIKSYRSSYEYTSHETEEYTYTVNFRSQFQNHFGEIIKSMGKDYFFLDTSEPGIPSFTVWGNSSGIIKLKKAIKMKFPEAEILEVPNGKQ
jgi:hypothetical protein